MNAGVDRVFLMRLGAEPRGVVASGWVDSEPYDDPHWDGTNGKAASYVEVSWDVVLDDDDVLPIATLQSQIPDIDWSPQAGGVRLPFGDAQELERLWSEHVGVGPKRGLAGRSQGWQADPTRRRLVEDYAQSLLEAHYSRQGWVVNDRRLGNPFDAIATKAGATIYLEAKGTETDGVSVLVTHGEVRWANDHRPGQCVIGIVCGVRFDDNGLPTGGTLKIHNWDPSKGILKPTAYTWAPPVSS